jgi:hypothetical protein
VEDRDGGGGRGVGGARRRRCQLDLPDAAPRFADCVPVLWWKMREFKLIFNNYFLINWNKLNKN